MGSEGGYEKTLPAVAVRAIVMTRKKGIERNTNDGNTNGKENLQRNPKVNPAIARGETGPGLLSDPERRSLGDRLLDKS